MDGRIDHACLQLRLAARPFAEVGPSKRRGPVNGKGQLDVASLRQAVREQQALEDGRSDVPEQARRPAVRHPGWPGRPRVGRGAAAQAQAASSFCLARMRPR